MVKKVRAYVFASLNTKNFIIVDSMYLLPGAQVKSIVAAWIIKDLRVPGRLSLVLPWTWKIKIPVKVIDVWAVDRWACGRKVRGKRITNAIYFFVRGCDLKEERTGGARRPSSLWFNRINVKSCFCAAFCVNILIVYCEPLLPKKSFFLFPDSCFGSANLTLLN